MLYQSHGMNFQTLSLKARSTLRNIAASAKVHLRNTPAAINDVMSCTVQCFVPRAVCVTSLRRRRQRIPNKEEFNTQIQKLFEPCLHTILSQLNLQSWYGSSASRLS